MVEQDGIPVGASGSLYYNAAGALPSGARPALKAGIDRYAADLDTERLHDLKWACQLSV